MDTNGHRLPEESGTTDWTNSTDWGAVPRRPVKRCVRSRTSALVETIFFLPQKEDLTIYRIKENPILQILSFCRKIRVISVIRGFPFAFL